MDQQTTRPLRRRSLAGSAPAGSDPGLQAHDAKPKTRPPTDDCGNLVLASLADIRPRQCKLALWRNPDARSKRPTFPIECLLQPVYVLARYPLELESLDLQRHQLERNKIGAPGIDLSEVHQRQV